MMYESPISVFFDRVVDDLKKQQDEHIYRAVVDVGVSVDKDELVKALNYDRGQYEKGYDDGYGAALRELVRCKDCKWFCKPDWSFGQQTSMGWCGYRNVDGVLPEDFYCADGEKKEENHD